MRGSIDERGKKLFIGGLHLKTTEDSLKSFYSQWGEIVDVVVMRDPQTGKSRGFGFVTYSDSSSVDDAQNNRPHEVDGIKVDSKRAMPKEDTSPEFHATVNRLFVGRLKRNVTADDLRQYFGEYGSITDAVIINNSNGESRGFGFVTFDDTDAVDKIIVTRPHQMDGQSLEVKKALPREGGSNKSSSHASKSQYGGSHSNRSGSHGQQHQSGQNYYKSSSSSQRTGPSAYSNSNSGGMDRRYSQNIDDYSSSYGNYPAMGSSSSSSGYNSKQYGGGGSSSYGQGYSQNYSSSSMGGHGNKYSNSHSRALNDSPPMDSGYGGGGGMSSSSGLGYGYLNDSNPYSSSSYGQYDTPNLSSNRYGYPPYSGGGGSSGGGGDMGDYSQRHGGGPIRGSGQRPIRSGGGGGGGGSSGYGNYPY